MKTPQWGLERIEEARKTRNPELSLFPGGKEKLSEIPAELFALNFLERIWLTSNAITVVPAFKKSLPKLRWLILLDNPLVEIADTPGLVLDADTWRQWAERISPQNLAGLRFWKSPDDWGHLIAYPNLTWLNISNLELKEIPEQLNKLSQLQILYAQGNRIHEIPKQLSNLSQLQDLDLSENQIQVIPEQLGNLSQLQGLWLSANKITMLPESVARLPKLKELDLDLNPLQDPPLEIVDQGLDAIHNYFEQRAAQGTVKLYEARLLIVGEPDAGKTTLMRKLLNPNHPVPSKQKSTVGITVERGWSFSFPEASDQSFQVHMWDFGGQEIQYMTHQFFLSPRALYVLLVDDRKQNTHYDYWFHIIDLLGGGSPVLVVLNERDGHAITNFDLKYYQQRYNKRFPIHCLAVDLADEESKLGKAIRKTTNGIAICKDLLNKANDMAQACGLPGLGALFGA